MPVLRKNADKRGCQAQSYPENSQKGPQLAADPRVVPISRPFLDPVQELGCRRNIQYAHLYFPCPGPEVQI